VKSIRNTKKKRNALTIILKTYLSHAVVEKKLHRKLQCSRWVGVRTAGGHNSDNALLGRGASAVRRVEHCGQHGFPGGAITTTRGGGGTAGADVAAASVAVG
jgi:hypothetical protein